MELFDLMHSAATWILLADTASLAVDPDRPGSIFRPAVRPICRCSRG